MTGLTIGQLAEAGAVNIETIRYYQRRGLLTEPPKPLGGHRRYAAEQVDRVRFIKRAQVLGFTLAEISALISLDSACLCQDTRALALHKLSLIEKKMADLAVMRQALDGLVRQCDEGTPGSACPIIEALASNNPVRA